jgi:toxin HigB-1
MKIQFHMILSFRHKGLRQFFETGSKAGIQASHAAKLRIMLTRLDSAVKAEDMNASGWRLHALKGDLERQWAVWVDQNWRLTFRFYQENAELVDYQDYH